MAFRRPRSSLWGWQNIKKVWWSLPGFSSCSKSVNGAISPIAEIHRFGYQGLEMGVTPITSDPPVKFWFLPLNFRFCWAKGVSSKGEMLSLAAHNDSIELNIETAIWPFGPLYQCINRQDRGSSCTGTVSDPAYQGETGLLLYTKRKEECVWDVED